MKSKRFLLPLLVTLCLFAGCSDDGPATDPADEPIAITESELKEAFYYTFPLMIMDATESVETNAETEAKIKEETQATIRCVPFAYEQTPGVDMVSGKPAVARVIIARSY